VPEVSLILTAAVMTAPKLKLLALPTLLVLILLLLLSAARRRVLLETLLLRAPVLPGDLLPLLPWPVAQPLLRRLALRGPADLLSSGPRARRGPTTPTRSPSGRAPASTRTGRGWSSATGPAGGSEAA
jgi:hypothetical protein